MNATYSGYIYGSYVYRSDKEVISFVDANLNGASFEGMIISPSNFSGASLRSSNFDYTYDQTHFWNTNYRWCYTSACNIYKQGSGDPGAPSSIYVIQGGQIVITANHIQILSLLVLMLTDHRFL